jgi:hypothetical protein
MVFRTEITIYAYISHIYDRNMKKREKFKESNDMKISITLKKGVRTVYATTLRTDVLAATL